MNRYYRCLLLLVSLPLIVFGQDPTFKWESIQSLGIHGQGWTETENPFDRLPARAEGKVTDSVWRLSHHTSGLYTTFETEATTFKIKWTVRFESLAMNHMPASGVSGIDIYAQTPEGTWRWLKTGIPNSVSNEVAVSGLDGKHRKYMVYLPLYNGLESLEVGVPEGNSLEKSDLEFINPPIVFYGTSIMHGCCASRPGMSYPAQLSRWLHREFINLGFSGSCKMEMEMADLLGELEASAYFIDCIPNMNQQLIEERAVPFLERLRLLRPDTPIFLAEDRMFDDAYWIDTRAEHHYKNRVALRKAYDTLVASGITNLHYIHSYGQFGTDGEGTVDASHPNDLGFYRQAQFYLPFLKAVLSYH